MKYFGWQWVSKDAPMKPFFVVKAFSSRSHHHTKRATNDDFSLHRLHHRHHTTAAGIAALAEKASFSGNLTLPANAAFARRQRLRWAQPPPPSPSPPANPPTNDSTNPPPTASPEIATITINPADVAMAAVLTQSEYSWGSGTVTVGGSRGGVTGGGGGRREGASAK